MNRDKRIIGSKLRRSKALARKEHFAYTLVSHLPIVAPALDGQACLLLSSVSPFYICRVNNLIMSFLALLMLLKKPLERARRYDSQQ